MTTFEPDARRAALEITRAVLALASRAVEEPVQPVPGELHITIATGAARSLSLEVEERLVRAAILYADRITLLSPAAYMLTAADRLRDATERDLVDLVRQVGPYLPNFDPAILQQPPDLLAALFASAGQASEIRQQLIDVTNELNDTPAMHALHSARELGFLRIESLAKRPEDDANLRAIREHLTADSWSDGEGLDGAAEVLLARLMSLLVQDHSLPLLDDQMGDMARQGIDEGLFVPASAASARIAHAGTAAGFIERLPTFPGASMGEIIDIRRELENPLLRFRREVVRISASMAEHALATDFAAHVDLEWHGTVRPALAEIEDAVSSNTYLTSLRTVARDPKRVLEAVGGATSGGVLGVIMGNTTPLTFALAAATSGLGAVFDAYNETRKVSSAQQSSGFWFLYEADRRMAQ